MVSVIIKRNKEGKLYSLRASGHADYAEKGNDIICAAVSVLTINTANSIEALTDDEIISNMNYEEIILDFELKTVSEKSSLLMEAMLFGLKGIEEENKEYLSVKVEEEH